jgi:polar amino acid transport system substrate-binding protein
VLSIGLSPTQGFTEQRTVKLVTELSTFTQESATDQTGGEATAFARQVLRGAGLAHQTFYFPWRRAYKYASAESDAMIFPLARTDQREGNFNWVGELIPVNYYLFKLKSREDISVTTLDEAKQYRVGVRNYHVHHEFLLAKGFTDLQPVNGNAQNLKKALLHRIDLFPVSDLGLLPVCARENIDCSQFEPVLKLEGISGGLYMAFGLTTDGATIQATRESYRKLVEDGTHAEVFQSRMNYIDEFNALWPMHVSEDGSEMQE